MGDVKTIFNVIIKILNKSFIVFGYRINLLAVIIGCALISFALYLFIGLYDD